MSDRSRKLVSAVTALSIALVWGPVGWAARVESGARDAYPGYLEVVPGTLTGKVLYPDGRTAVTDAAVQVWSVAEEKLVQETRTDKEGRYEIQALEEGAYSVLVADRVVVDLRVTAGGSAERQLNVIVPRGKPFFAVEPGQEETSRRRVAAVGGGGGRLKTVLIIGASVATAVGVTAALGGFSGKGHHRTIVSP